MTKRNLLPIIAIGLVLGFGAVSATANMAPPENFLLGIAVAPSPDGPRVSGFDKGSPAQAAGVRLGDILLGADGRYTKAVPPAELDTYLKRPRWRAELIVVHDGRTIEVVHVTR